MTAPASFFSIAAIADALQSNALVITANQRLASRLLTAYALDCRRQGIAVAETPMIMSLEQWQQGLWHQALIEALPAALDWRPLSADEELLVWQQVIAESAQADGLLNLSATARQLQSAWQTLGLWQVDTQSQHWRALCAANPDTQAFAEWAGAFADYCRQGGRISRVEMTALLCEWLKQGRLKPPARLVTVGFDLLPPLHEQLLASAGQWQPFLPQGTPRSAGSLVLEDAEQELYAALAWAKMTLQDRPESTIAVVVPDLASRQQQVERAVQHVFFPEQLMPDVPRQSLPVNMSAGTAFDQLPLMVAASDVLALVTEQLPLVQIERLCLSPFYREQPGHLDRAAGLVQQLYRLQQADIRTAQFRSLAARLDDPAQPWWLPAALQQFREELRRLQPSVPRPMAEWLRALPSLLGLFGWPRPSQSGQPRVSAVSAVAGASAILRRVG